MNLVRTEAIFPRSGEWHSAKIDGRRSASITCPDCDGSSLLSTHEISSAGIVTPDVVCPYDECNFNEMVTLESWGTH